MRILCLTPWFPSHPQDQKGNFILDSVNSLIELGHEVIVLITTAWKPKKTKHQKISDNLQIYSCRYFSIPRHYLSPISFWNYRQVVSAHLRKIIDKHQIELIHAHTEYAGMAAVKVGKELGLPTVVTVHGVSTDKKLYSGITRKQLFDYPLNNADRVVLVGLSLTDFASQFVNHKNHFKVVPNGFRQSIQNSLTNNKSWAENNLRFISVSNLEEGKGIDINLQALAKLNQNGMNNWTYKIIGNGTQRKFLENLCQEYKLNQQVFFLGAVNHNEVYEELNEADIFILPSYREAFGVAYLEAMSCGLLAIGVEAQGPADFIEHGKTGFLVKPRNINNLFEIMKSLFESKDLTKEIAIAGKIHIHQNFTWNQHAIKLTHLYSNLVRDKKCFNG